MTVRLTVRQLKRLIVQEWGKPYSGPSHLGTHMSSTDEREPLEVQSVSHLDDDELSPHLQDASQSGEDEDDQGPVGRRHRSDDLEFAPTSDPYAQDWHVLPTPRFANR